MKVSIIIPTYNYAHYIGRAIESVMNQSYQKELIELIVIDDGSTDNTAAVIKDCQLHFPIQYHYQQNQGKAVATQLGIALATGDIIFTLDADDWFLPGKIADTVAIFQQYPQVVHVASAARIQWADGGVAKTEPVPSWLLSQCNNGHQVLQFFFEHNMLFGGGSTFAVRANAAKQFNWKPAIDMYTDEWLVIQALLAGDSYFLAEPQSVWFVHGSNYSAAGGGALLQKQQRMRVSSQCILQLLQQGPYPPWLQHAYTLKHAMRHMIWLEAAGKKTAGDVWRFFAEVILHKNNSFIMLYRYHAFNRLLKW